jgi:hypothetical protein
MQQDIPRTTVRAGRALRWYVIEWLNMVIHELMRQFAEMVGYMKVSIAIFGRIFKP